MIPNIGPMEIGIVLLIALIVFGPKKLPELGRSVGTGFREFKDSISSDEPEEIPASVAVPEPAEKTVA